MKKSSIKSTKPLSAKKPLKTKSVLKSRAKPKKRPVPTITKLRKLADQHFSWYVRLRDSDFIEGQWWGKCITCGRRYLVAFPDPETKKIRFTNLVDNGHFVSRGHLITRYEEENCNLQCKRCNKWLSGNLTVYRKELDLKYGTGTAEKLEKLAYDNPDYSLKRDVLTQVISDGKEALKFYGGMA